MQDERFQAISLDEIEAGDLLFFGESEQKITHVGMYIGNGQFIHAIVKQNQPWIRISHLSDAELSGHSDSIYPYRTARQAKKDSPTRKL